MLPSQLLCFLRLALPVLSLSLTVRRRLPPRGYHSYFRHSAPSVDVAVALGSRHHQAFFHLEDDVDRRHYYRHHRRQDLRRCLELPLVLEDGVVLAALAVVVVVVLAELFVVVSTSFLSVGSEVPARTVVVF
ncbi:MAG: hypothetical protein GY738_04725 [Pseudoalteromonas sp.]|nr:hypothetical protein [Pseudoalteromonas sp.]